MTDLRYDTGGLRDGGRRDHQSSDAADEAGRRLGGLSVSSGLFGDVGAAGPFAGALSGAQRAQRAGARSAAADRDDQGSRAGVTAGLGDGLTARTAAAAGRGAAARVADGMS